MDGAQTAARVDYALLAQTVASLTSGETDSVSLMATVACEVHHSDDRFDWTGFYRVTAPDLLKIGPYQGGMAVWSSPLIAVSAVQPPGPGRSS